MDQQYTFFYRSRHPFSNWYSCKFTDSSGIEYNCSEQYMMAEKARLFGDKEALDKILASIDPREQKAIGRTVKGFISEDWDKVAKDIVFTACYLKFSQNDDILQVLLDAKGIIVEASPTDVIWGVGLSEDDPAIQDPKNWRGTNWLGEVLTNLRDTIVHIQQKVESKQQFKI